jgi:hypothetical protein
MAYLGTTSGVLGGTTGDQLGVPGEQVLVDTHVPVLSENGIVLLKAVLLEESSITKYDISMKLSRFTPELSIPTSLNVYNKMSALSSKLPTEKAHTEERVLQTEKRVTLSSSHCE